MRFLASLAAIGGLVVSGFLLPATPSVAQTTCNNPDTCTNAPQTLTANGKQYRLVWDDEFNGDKLSDKWDKTHTPVENGAMVYANVEDPSHPAISNILVKDGYLRLRAIQKNNLGKDKVATSGGIQTKGLSSFKYGHFEARIRLNDAEGTWPALWMMPAQGTYGWPCDGEIDWFEYPRSINPKQNLTTIHTCNHLSTRGKLHDTSTVAFSKNSGQDLAWKWHVWTMDWDQTGLTFKMDGTEYARIKVDQPQASQDERHRGSINRGHRWANDWLNPDGSVHEDTPELAPFDKNFYLIFNLGIKKAGQWAGPKGPVDWRNAKIDLDYVRVYQTKDQQAAQKTHYIKFDTRNASAANPPMRNVKDGDKVGQLPDVTARDGRKAIAWYTKPALVGSPVTEQTPVKSDLTLFPKWGSVYTVKFDNRGHGKNVTDVTVTAGKSATLPTLSENGYTFTGWYTDADFNNKADTNYTPTGNVTLYAKWVANQKPVPPMPAKVKLSYDLRGHGGSLSDVMVDAGSKVMLATPHETGWSFQGWYYDPGFTKPAAKNIELTQSTMLYAKWQPLQLTMAFLPKVSFAGFRDVAPYDPFSGEIEWALDHGITQGWPDNTFRPWAKINRDAMAAFLYRLAGSPAYTPPARSPFTDVKPTTMFYKEISWCARRGITKGWPDHTFRPTTPINRDAMAAFLYRYVQTPEFAKANTHSKVAALVNHPGKSPFRDTANSPFETEIAWLAKARITTGWPDNTYRPLRPIDRNAMIAFIYRMVNNYYR